MKKISTEKINCFINILLYRLKLSKYPVAVRWNITGRCFNNCSYCSYHKVKKKELTKTEIEKIFIILRKWRICRMSISGGEPLINDNLEFIIDSCLDNNISPIINTSGYNIENKIPAIKKVDLIQLSIDGPPEIMAKNRNIKAFDYLSNAIAVANQNNIKISFCCTLTKYSTSIKNIKYLIDFAKKNKAMIAFQPLKNIYPNNYYAILAPENKIFKETIDFLYDLKKKGEPSIRNTLHQLRYVSFWPEYKEIKCVAGKLFFIIQPDGSVLSCDRSNNKVNNNINLLVDNENVILNQIKNINCNGCGFLGALELADIYNFDFSVLKTLKSL